MNTPVEADDFDIAKALFDKLKDVPIERRQRILGWVSESLGVKAAAPLSPPSPTLPSHPATPTPTPPAGDIKSFVAAKAPKSDAQFATTVAYYYRFEAPPERRKQTINGNDLQEGARLAGRNRLKKPSKTLNNAKTLGYLDSSAPGEFSVNSVGENLVAMTLPGASEAGSNGTRRRGRGKKAKKTGRKKR